MIEDDHLQWLFHEGGRQHVELPSTRAKPALGVVAKKNVTDLERRKFQNVKSIELDRTYEEPTAHFA